MRRLLNTAVVADRLGWSPNALKSKAESVVGYVG
jgi:hypothetical protein